MSAKGNEFLKRAHTETEYTPNLVQELIKCSKDPKYFIRNYIKIQHPVRGSVPFELYDYQEEILDLLINKKDSMILTARQMGKCFLGDTSINIIKKPNRFKMFLLYILDRKLYEQIKKL